MLSKFTSLFRTSLSTETEQDARPMKLGVSYNVFDGEELLECSIRSVRENVDYVSSWRAGATARQVPDCL